MRVPRSAAVAGVLAAAIALGGCDAIADAIESAGPGDPTTSQEAGGPGAGGPGGEPTDPEVDPSDPDATAGGEPGSPEGAEETPTPEPTPEPDNDPVVQLTGEVYGIREGVKLVRCDMDAGTALATGSVENTSAITGDIALMIIWEGTDGSTVGRKTFTQVAVDPGDRLDFELTAELPEPATACTINARIGTIE